MINKINEYIKLSDAIKLQKQILETSVNSKIENLVEADMYALNKLESQLSKLAIEIVDNFLSV